MTHGEAEHATNVLSKANVDIATLIPYLNHEYYTGYLVAIGNLMVDLMKTISEEDLHE